jgi:NAD(P)-dependent dehydrogenase (short-subunit alcohol dehydrogenase family)
MSDGHQNQLAKPQGMLDLSGVVVAVTGTGGLIGSGIARRLASAGASLVLHYRSSGESATQLAEEVKNAGTESCLVGADLAERGGPDAVIQAGIDAFGRVDCLVNNAGFQPQHPFLDIGADEFDYMLSVNVVAPHLLTTALARHLLERGSSGSIVHIASISGTQTAHDHAHYCTSKAALIMHAKAAALELGGAGIRVNTVSPGLIGREGIEEAWPEGVARWQAAAPLRRLGSAEDIGDACLFLVSDLSRWITGTNLVVDGGVSAGPTY